MEQYVVHFNSKDSIYNVGGDPAQYLGLSRDTYTWYIDWSKLLPIEYDFYDIEVNFMMAGQYFSNRSGKIITNNLLDVCCYNSNNKCNNLTILTYLNLDNAYVTANIYSNQSTVKTNAFYNETCYKQRKTIMRPCDNNFTIYFVNYTLEANKENLYGNLLLYQLIQYPQGGSIPPINKAFILTITFYPIKGH